MRWIPVLIGALVMLFGVYRTMLGLRPAPKPPEVEGGASAPGASGRPGGLPPLSGMRALPRRTHLLFGVVYLLMGGFLLLSALGIRLR